MESTSTTMMTTTNLTTNATAPDPPYGGINLTLANQIVNIIILALLMLSMGVTIDFNDIKKTFRRPIAFFIGMASQFVLMPLIGFCLSLAFRLQPAGALSVLILACCPGGTLSNLFTYWTDGDVCLSVSMTTVSTAVAIGMMPLNLFIYTRVWTDESSVIPYVNIVKTLVTILVPAAFGVFLRWWKEEWSKWITRICLVLTLICLVAAFTFAILLNPNFYKAQWQLWICAAILPLVGYSIGYGFAFLLRQPYPKCRTIAFETGSQNVSLALTLTVLTFPNVSFFLDMLFYPILYAIFIYVDTFAVIAVYRLVLYLRKDNGEAEEDTDSKFAKTEMTEVSVNGGIGNENKSPDAVYSQDVDVADEI